MKRVMVEVTDKHAIHVDGTRITNRSTKHGEHTIIDRFMCNSNMVNIECGKRKHTEAVKKIDKIGSDR